MVEAKNRGGQRAKRVDHELTMCLLFVRRRVETGQKVMGKRKSVAGRIRRRMTRRTWRGARDRGRRAGTGRRTREEGGDRVVAMGQGISDNRGGGGERKAGTGETR